MIILPSGCGCDLKPNSTEKSGPSQSLWHARGKTGSSRTRRDSKYAWMVSSATLDSLRCGNMKRMVILQWVTSWNIQVHIFMINFCPPNHQFILQTSLQITIKVMFTTYMLIRSLTRSKTTMFLLRLAKYKAQFLRLDRMLQSAPYSSRRRTISVFPLLHAWSQRWTFIEMT